MKNKRTRDADHMGFWALNRASGGALLRNKLKTWTVSIVRGLLLFGLCFMIIQPLLTRLGTSLMAEKDLYDSTVVLLPRNPTLDNYRIVFELTDFPRSMLNTLWTSFVVSLLQVAACTLVAYGFARYDFPLKKFWLGVLILAFLLPTQVTSLPNYLTFSRLKLADGTVKPFLITATLGQGLKSVLCILIFYNFHRQTPQSLVEAAEIDGAGHFKAYWRIAVPLCTAAIVVVTLFSFVWYWNETTLVREYLGYGHTRAKGLTTLMIELQKFEDSYNTAFDSRTTSVTSTNKLNDAIRMAGTMLSIAPMLILYFVLQKQFVESVDRAGITGE